MTILLYIIAFILLNFAAWALVDALTPEGYEDETGFHRGRKP